jgi:surface antigen
MGNYQSKIQKNLGRFTLSAWFTTVGIALMSSVITSVPANAQSTCQCTTYTANRFNLSKDYPHAGDWDNGYLQRNGFVRVNPQPGAIAIMERSFSGANTTYGHVGVVESISNGRVNLRGANQSVGSNYFSEAGCGNVRITPFGASINGNPNISFWARGTTPPTQQTNNNGVNLVNFSGTTAPAGVNVRSDASTSASIVGRLGGYVRVNFDGWKYGESIPDTWTGRADRRWYRIAGTNQWIASAVVNGNAPGSQP